MKCAFCGKRMPEYDYLQCPITCTACSEDTGITDEQIVERIRLDMLTRKGPKWSDQSIVPPKPQGQKRKGKW